MIADVITVISAVLSVYCAVTAGVYARAAGRFRKAADWYAADRPADGDAEMAAGRKVKRRAERMIPLPGRTGHGSDA